MFLITETYLETISIGFWSYEISPSPTVIYYKNQRFIKILVSPIIIAAKNSHTSCVEELLRYNVNVNQTDKDGNSALGYASASGETAIAEKLLVNGAYLNHPNHKGDTPLILAARNSNLQIAKLLVGRQCNVNHAGNGNKTALYWATDNSKVEIVRELLRNEMETF